MNVLHYYHCKIFHNVLQCEKVGHSCIIWVHLLFYLALCNLCRKKTLNSCVCIAKWTNKNLDFCLILKNIFGYQFVWQRCKYFEQPYLVKCQVIPTRKVYHAKISIRFQTFRKQIFRRFGTICLKRCRGQKLTQIINI